MTNAESFFAMGGYAAYVWPALLATAAVMIALLFLSRRRLIENQRTVERLEAELPSREQRRARRGGDKDGGSGEGEAA